jgi:hypothetical protein
MSVEPLSEDQAWHLAGFAPECARKACIEENLLDRVLGHDLGADADVWIDWWIPLDGMAWRYRLTGWADQDNVLQKWSPAHRYEPTGTRSGPAVVALVSACRRQTERVTADLWALARFRPGSSDAVQL